MSNQNLPEPRFEIEHSCGDVYIKDRWAGVSIPLSEARKLAEVVNSITPKFLRSQIELGFASLGGDGRRIAFVSFHEGVRWAEREHGIGTAPEAP